MRAPAFAALPVLTLAACGDPTEVPNETEPAPEPPPVIDTVAVEDPTVGPEGEAIEIPGSAWFYKADQQMAVFGPPNSAGVLAIHCRGGEIVVTRYSAAREGGTAILSFRGDGHSAAVAVEAVAMELGPDHVWQGTATPASDDLRRVFASNTDPITVSAGLERPIRVPASEAPVRAIDACA